MTPEKRLCLVQDVRLQIQLMLRMDMYPKVSNASHVMHKYLKSQSNLAKLEANNLCYYGSKRYSLLSYQSYAWDNWRYVLASKNNYVKILYTLDHQVYVFSNLKVI